MSELVAHFRGGPLDGQSHEMQELPPTWRVPEKPVFGLESDEQTLPRHHIYRRAPGVVAHQAVYEYEGLLHVTNPRSPGAEAKGAR
jgi:hypothetical protein